MYPLSFTIVISSFLATCHNREPASFENFTTCEQFERGAKFDPTKIVDSPWRIFYFWSDTTELEPVHFSLIHKNSLKRFKVELEAMHSGWDIMWHLARFFFFPRPGVQVLYLDAYTPGAYRAVVKLDRKSDVLPQPGPLFKMADIRMKQVDRFIFMMCCEDLTGYAMVREKEVPKTLEDCQDQAAVMKYRGYEGRCYLELLKNITDRRTVMLEKNVTEGTMERLMKNVTDWRKENQAHLPVGPSPLDATQRHRRHRRRKRKDAKTQHLVLQRLKQARAMLVKRRTGGMLHSSRLWERKRGF